LRGEVLAALFEHAPRLALQPALHAVADLRGGGGVRQADVQREARHAGQRGAVGVQQRTTFRGARARVEHHDHGLAEEGYRRAVAPVDLRRLQALRALLLLGELAQDPYALLPECGFNVAHADPLRRVDAEALDADDEADAAALGALEFIGHEMVAQDDLARGLRVAEDGGGEHAGQGGGRLRGAVRRGSRWRLRRLRDGRSRLGWSHRHAD